MAGGSGSDLSRDLGLFSVFTVTTGTMIGAGIFILPGPVAEAAGPAAVLSFGIAGMIALIATMCAVELATAMPKAGGSYYFTSRAMGPLVGTVVGFGTWLSLIFKGSFALVGLGWYVTEFLEVPVLGVGFVGGVLLILVNWVGAEETGKLQNVIVVGLVGILAVFVSGGALDTDVALWYPFMTDGVEGVIAATGLVFISYLGVIKAVAVGEEVKDPGETLPKALFGAVIFVTVLYMGVILIVTGVMPIADIADSTAPVAAAGKIFLGAFGGAVIAIAGILATVSTANAAVLTSSRFPFAMSRDGLLPQKLQESSPRFGTPTFSIWLTGSVIIVLVFLFDVEGLAKIGGTFGILVFALLNLTVVLLRRAQPEWYDPSYRVPMSPMVPVIGAGAALALIPFMGQDSQTVAVAFIGIGSVWYYIQTQRGEPVKPDHDVIDLLRGTQYRRSIEEKRSEFGELVTDESHIIVETVEQETHPHLEAVMQALSTHFDADLDVLTSTEVSAPVPLAESGHDANNWQNQIRGDLELDDQNVAFDHVRTRDRTDTLLNAINDQTVSVLVDWHDPIRKYHLRESHVDEILRTELPVRLAVLKHRGEDDIDEIIIATDSGPYDRAEVELADAVATATGATLTLVQAIPEDAPEEAVTSSKKYLADLADLLSTPADIKLEKTNNVEQTLIEEGNRADLLVMGGPSHPDRVHEFFGQTTDIVTTETESSVLVVKEPSEEVPDSRRLWRWLQSHL